jgi:S-formylglutathione hydrolase FrmB
MPALYADCGTEDFLLMQNRAFREAIQGAGVMLTYVEHSGGHTWGYWRSHLPESAAWLAARLAVP